jgi:O-acetyl-ADP-ribose deacetylase (regulator of RNase III)
VIYRTEGDLFACGITALAHGVNCRGVMGAGIATQFRARWPLMYSQYRKWCERRQLEPGDCWTWPANTRSRPEDGVVFNLATQDQPGSYAQPWMITAAVGRMVQECAGPHGMGIKQVAMPEIGCGIGGLDLTDLLGALMPYERAPVDLVVVSYNGRQP